MLTGLKKRGPGPRRLHRVRSARRPLRCRARRHAPGARTARPRPPARARDRPGTWRFPAFDELRPLLATLPPDAETILFFVPYNRVRLPPPGHPAAALWAECKRRAVALARGLGSRDAGRGRGRVLVVDFLRHSPITDEDMGYWDAQHYRVGVADRLARDLAAASRGEASADYEVLFAGGR